MIDTRYNLLHSHFIKSVRKNRVSILHIMLFFTFFTPLFGQGKLTVVKGETQGTTYLIQYDDSRNFKTSIDSILLDFDKSLSLYRIDSEISTFNRSHAIRFQSPYFYKVLQKSKEIYEATQGIFDPTIMPLTEAYGFGPKERQVDTNLNLDSLLNLVGFDQIQFDSIMVQKSKEHVRLDFNGIAQGYSVDLIAEFLESKKIKNYLVEIGGEIRSKGFKKVNTLWTVGISNPVKPSTILAKVTLNNRAMTTSGNYRNHFEKDGQVFNHLINPKTGSMDQTNVLSVTVFAKNAITADGYDTAFFLMGIEKTKAFLKTHPDIDVYLIYTEPNGKLKTYISSGIKDFIKPMEIAN